MDRRAARASASEPVGQQEGEKFAKCRCHLSGHAGTRRKPRSGFEPWRGATRGANIRLRQLDPSPTAKGPVRAMGGSRRNDLGWAEGIAIVLETGAVRPWRDQQSLDPYPSAAAPSPRFGHVFGENPVRLVKERLQTAGVRLLSEEERGEQSFSYVTHIGRRLPEQKI